jgi:Icc-related predicted phosphoesterase
MKIAVIGDIHGQFKTLEKMLEQIKEHNVDEVVFVGDLIDRGQESNKVVELVKNTPNFFSVLGNHEIMLLQNDNLANIRRGKPIERIFSGNGGNTTMNSYGYKPSSENPFPNDEQKQIFWDDVNYLLSLPLVIRYNNFKDKDVYISHSYLGPTLIASILNEHNDLYTEKDFENKTYFYIKDIDTFLKKELSEYSNEIEKIIWNRNVMHFTDMFSGPTPKQVEDNYITIFGHTQTPYYLKTKVNQCNIDDRYTYMINIDTGAAYNEQLSAVILDTEANETKENFVVAKLFQNVTHI